MLDVCIAARVSQAHGNHDWGSTGVEQMTTRYIQPLGIEISRTDEQPPNNVKDNPVKSPNLVENLMQ